MLPFILAAIGGYLLGSIPTGFLIGRARGVDMRALGSGNIGATNALRVLGKTAGAMVLALDAGKGLLACWGLPRVAVALASTVLLERQLLAVAAGAGAILGHNYTCWLRFKGGKGVATSAGVLAVLAPWALLLVTTLWGVALAVGRYVSLASLSAAVALPFFVWWTRGDRAMIILAALMAFAVIVGHRANIRRLLNGTEHRFTRTKPKLKAEAPPPCV